MPNYQKKVTNNPVLQKLLDEGSFTHQGKNYPLGHCTPQKICQKYADVIRRNKIDNALEIGTLFGFSTLFLAEALAETNGKLTTVDLRFKKRTWFNGDEIEDIHEVAEKYIEESGYDRIVDFVAGNSNQVLPKLYESGKRFQFALIDGSHAFNVAMLDFIFCDSLIETGGYIALDDIGANIAQKENLNGGPNRMLEMIFASSRYEIVPLNANVVLCQKIRQV